MNEPESTAELLARYEVLAIAWDGEHTARLANRIFDQLHSIAVKLRAEDEGRRGLELLLTHENRGVRLKAASDCLAWGSAGAVAALEGLVSPRGAHSLTAEMTLQEYKAGRMRFDW